MPPETTISKTCRVGASSGRPGRLDPTCPFLALPVWVPCLETCKLVSRVVERDTHVDDPGASKGLP